MQTGTGKRTVRETKKYSHSARPRKMERKQEGKIKKDMGRERDREKK